MAAELKAGMPAPSFRLLEASGGEVSFADFRGKWLVLFFYPKASTSG